MLHTTQAVRKIHDLESRVGDGVEITVCGRLMTVDRMKRRRCGG